jgi:hypothetical protein
VTNASAAVIAAAPKLVARQRRNAGRIVDHRTRPAGAQAFQPPQRRKIGFAHRGEGDIVFRDRLRQLSVRRQIEQVELHRRRIDQELDRGVDHQIAGRHQRQYAQARSVREAEHLRPRQRLALQCQALGAAEGELQRH